MATNVVFNGINYSVPSFNDTGYAQGPGNLSLYLVALASGTLQPSGGTFALTADVNFGPNFGLVAKYLISTATNPASLGMLRLSKTDTIDWRNNANTNNLPLGINGSDQLTFNGSVLATSGGTLAVSGGGTGNTSFTAFSIIAAGTTATAPFQNVSGTGVATQVLTSNGPGLLPTWQSPVTGSGTVTSGTKDKLALYPATGTTVSDTDVIGGNSIDIIFGSQAGRASALEYVIPNPSNSVVTTNFVLTDRVQTLNQQTTLLGGFTLFGTGGNPGGARFFPATAGLGTLSVVATNNSGNTDTTITNASQGGNRTYTVPDAGTDASFVMTQGTQTIFGPKTFGTTIAFAPTTTGIIGTTAGDSASSGIVGEWVRSYVTGIAAAPTGQYQDTTTIVLTAGDWDVSGVWLFMPDTGATSLQFGISTGTAGNTFSDDAPGDNRGSIDFAAGANTNLSGCIASFRVLLIGTVTIRLKTNYTYTSGSPATNGRLSARRVR
jgi:hypothetical protein